MKNYWLIIFVLSCVSCSVKNISKYNPYQKFGPDALQADFQLLRNVLEADHPSIYWHSTKQQIDSVFDTNAQLLKDSLNEFEFKNIVANVLSNIKCGHTSVRNTPKFENWIATANLSYFPFGMRLFADSLIATYNLYRKDTLIPRGSLIKSINGVSSSDIIKKMYSVISTDGDANNFKNLRISNNFPYYYLSSFDSAKKYEVVYADENSIEKTVSFSDFKRPPPDTTKRKIDSSIRIIQAPPTLTKLQKRERIRKLYIDTIQQVAFLTINSFSGGKQRKFYKQTFKYLDQKNIENLVIDVRNNGGGLIGNATYLSKYISNKKFRVADSVYTNHIFSKYNKHVKFRFWYSLSELLFTHKKGDGNHHFGWLTKRNIKPKKKHHFDGQVYTITGGYSFSATTLFINYTAAQNNVTTIGEPTGGTALGNTAVYIPNLKLPHTQLKVRMPVFRLVMNKSAIKGAPFYPEIYVGPTMQTLKKGNDNKIEKVYELIKASKN
jgi:hypothetical protein